MRQWEYRTFTAHKGVAAAQAKSKKPIGWVARLNDLGKQGWEAVGIVVLEEVIRVVLKRPVIR